MLLISGTTINIADGLYRESVSPPSGLSGKEIVFKATGSNAFMLGSVSASSLTWEVNTLVFEILLAIIKCVGVGK